MITVDDMTVEMKGLKFRLHTAWAKIPLGSIVEVVDWPPTTLGVSINYKSPFHKGAITVPKYILAPVTAPVAGIQQYTVGLKGQQAQVEKCQKQVNDQRIALELWKKDEGKYAKNHDYWEKQLQPLQHELGRREGVLSSTLHTLGQMLVRETMYNRFDQTISTWVKHYEAKIKPEKKIDPNIVKSIIFQETRMGTSGRHLELPPYTWNGGKTHPVKSRFNLMQSVDSSAHQQLIMMEEMAPAIFIKHKLPEAVRENQKKGKTESELYAWNGGAIPKAMREFFVYRDTADKNLMETPARDLHEDYAFWIRTGVRWLFQKYVSLNARSRTWPEAVRAFNGSGADAHTYRNEVMGRVGAKGTLKVGNT
ncbi:hypothetical protein [Corallococcus carmarthensis]|uniref:Uncharacterized protein n=1 Tax=Corallococcus carmarthensis TaxID=2316728 RepID=A0A3A8K2T3_9BACT|nr:hypothetical protein [Corallococcus carmarthensis]RKG96033.1 hypothetical protein D7X32_37265 [Corallococcus carmarthensis]